MSHIILNNWEKNEETGETKRKEGRKERRMGYANLTCKHKNCGTIYLKIRNISRPQLPVITPNTVFYQSYLFSHSSL